MVIPDLRLMLILIAAVCGGWLIARRYDPRGRSSRVLTHMMAGFLLLAAWNALAAPGVGINPLSAWLTGALGLPGVGLMVFLNLL